MFSPKDVERATVTRGVTSNSIELVTKAIIDDAVRVKNEGEEIR